MMTPAHASPPRFLVTAGNTRERIDQVRDWGNIFTGNTGFAIARTLAELGPVDLCTSNREHRSQLPSLALAHPVHGFAFTTHAELRNLLETRLRQETYQAVFMSAAVADYQPAGVYQVIARQPGDTAGEETWRVRLVQAGKVKSHYQAIAVLGQPTEKLVDLFRHRWQYRGLLIKFKLEVGLSDEALLAVARQSRIASGADYLVANTLAMVQASQPSAYIVSAEGAMRVDRKELATALKALVQDHLRASLQEGNGGTGT